MRIHSSKTIARFQVVIAAMFGMLAAAIVVNAAAQEKKPPPPAAKKSDATPKPDAPPIDRGRDTLAVQDDWVKISGPGEAHKRLEPLVGKWNMVMKQDASGPEEKGVSEFKWIMGKRFLLEETRTQIMGQSFEWSGWHGYDNAKNKYVAAFIDNLGTGIDSMEGEWDEASKTLVYTGEEDDPMSGEKKKIKWALRFESKDKVVMTFLEAGKGGKETKVLEITATRQ